MKNIKHNLIPRLLGVAIASAALITPGIAFAQDAPSQQIQGTVAAINGTWNINVADSNGYVDSVELHQGTIINPTGLTLEDGMNVTIDGYADGPNFDAMEIDTPYQYSGPAPVAVYYGPGAWYPGYAEGWGPSFSLSFNLGSRQWAQRSFVAGGEIRHSVTPPSGWQNQPHGYIGNAGNSRSFARTAYAAPQQQARSYAAPQQQARTYAAPQQQARSYAVPQQQARSYAAPPQQARSYAAPPQQARTYAAPQQQARSFAAPPQQARTYAAPQQQARSYAAPQQQARSFAAPPQQARSFSAPVARAAAPAARGNQPGGDRHR